MAERVYNADRGHCPSNDCEHLPNEVVEGGAVLLIDDVDGLNLRHEHGFLSGIVAEGPTRTNRVAVILAVRSGVALLNDHGDDL